MRRGLLESLTPPLEVWITAPSRWVWAMYIFCQLGRETDARRLSNSAPRNKNSSRWVIVNYYFKTSKLCNVKQVEGNDGKWRHNGKCCAVQGQPSCNRTPDYYSSYSSFKIFNLCLDKIWDFSSASSLRPLFYVQHYAYYRSWGGLKIS